MRTTMSEQPASIRIWVALDESPCSAAALRDAAALAAEMDAELAGLFVEDINLQHLIGLPFAREFSLLTGAGSLLSQEDVERTWRREAETMQRLLAEAAKRLRLRWSFRVARGRVSAELNTLAQAFDLIVLGQRSGMGVTATSPATSRFTRPHPQMGPVLVLFEAGSTFSPSLDMGARLARLNRVELVMLVSAAAEDAYRAACAAAQAALKARDMSGRCVWLSTLDDSSLIKAARREAASCLVLANKERFLTQAGFDRMLDEIECPVVLT
jgi:nucleotide-binding universal stress UspA family protein